MLFGVLPASVNFKHKHLNKIKILWWVKNWVPVLCTEYLCLFACSECTVTFSRGTTLNTNNKYSRSHLLIQTVKPYRVGQAIFGSISCIFIIVCSKEKDVILMQ